MIKMYKEHIPSRKVTSDVGKTRYSSSHDCVYFYDTNKIKQHCAKCGDTISGNLEKNYKERGNYCAPCNGGYTKLKIII